MMDYDEGVDFCEELGEAVMSRATNPATVDTYEVCMLGGEFYGAVTAAVGAVEEDHLLLASDVRAKFVKFLTGHDGLTTESHAKELLAVVRSAPTEI